MTQASNEKMNYREDNFYINKVLKGNLASYAILVEKHKSMAYTLALRISKNHEDAEEVAQDSFLKAYNSLNSFKQESKFSTWLYKIIYNTALSRFRKKHIDSFSMDDSPIKETIYEENDDGLTRGVEHQDDHEDHGQKKHRHHLEQAGLSFTLRLVFPAPRKTVARR